MRTAPEGLHPVEQTHTEAVQEVQSVGRGISWTISHGRDLLDQGKSVRGKEDQRQRDEPTTCILHSPVPLRGAGKGSGNEVERGGGKCFQDLVLFLNIIL